MAAAVVTVVIETIGVFLQEGKFLSGVKDQVKELQQELKLLQSFLKDAMARRHDHERFRTCVSQAKLLAYEAEDIVEEYAIKVAPKGGGGFKKVARRVVSIVGEGSAIHKVGNKIEKIKTEIVKLTEKFGAYGITKEIEAQPSTATIDERQRRRPAFAQEMDEYFVGMEDDVSNIVRWVTEDDKKSRVISICGCGGSGKTTIARKVFNHIKKCSNRSFECFAWVSVAQECQVKLLLQDILYQILGENLGGPFPDLEVGALVRQISSELESKKCFVVLDDIWKMDDWESLRPAFPISEGSSKILLTTRKTEVAQVAHCDFLHEPKFLDEKDGWDLLTKIALDLQEHQGNAFSLSETVKNVGTSMLRKCGGLPLAISVLGGILRNKDPLTKWKKVDRSFGTHLRADGGVLSVLALSYDDLPYYLRSCFLYMGCFKEDEDIEITRLFQLWMAEGLLSTRPKEPEETLMDVASDILYELISRNLVQPIVISELTGKQSCKLHDLMRGVCLSKGKEEEFMEVKSIKIHTKTVAFLFTDGVNFCRQAILVDSKINQCEISIAKSPGKTCFRALIFNGGNKNVVKGAIEFKRLRSLVLDACIFEDNKLPKEIRDMIHLRYLSLRDSLKNGELPTFIGDLQHIQILDVCSHEVQLPNIFHKMTRLRCLYLPGSRVQSESGKKLQFHGLNGLEVVEGLHSKYDQFPDLLELVNLGRLSCTICDYEDLSTILEQLSSLKRLQYVDIAFVTKDSGPVLQNRFSDLRKLLLCPSLHRLCLNAPITNFPTYKHEFWLELVTLKLSETKFEEDPMPFLQELPNLRKLTMGDDAYVGKEMYCSSKAFPKLTELEITALPNIEKWKVDAGAFPNLQTLTIENCRSLEEIVPDGLTNITTLTKTVIKEMPEKFRNKYRSLTEQVRDPENELVS